MVREMAMIKMIIDLGEIAVIRIAIKVKHSIHAIVQ
jgi:hypothetical protein